MTTGRPNRSVSDGGGQDLRLRSVLHDPPAAQQHHARDLRDDLLDVVRDQDQRRAGPGDLADPLHEIVAGDQIEAGGRLVEDQRVAVR